ncbi:MAG TPA: helix-turn-helix domain-containing protein [Candidatus Pacearchaeota archaeon]|nr:helix-turn-helix domain-containing protein [Candidatus Pacearchaeota archaeon]
MNIDFIQIPTIVIQSDAITDGDKLIYGIIYYLSQLSDKECWASNKTIAEIRGCSPSTISHAVKRLEDAKFVNIWNKTSKKRRIKPLIILKVVDLNSEPISPNAEPIPNKIEQPISNEIQNNNIYNNNIIYNNIYNNIIKELYKINDRIYYIGKTKTQLSALKVLLQMGEQKLGSVERVEQIIEWYVAQYLKLKDQPENFKFFPKALVPTQLLDKWSSIENLYNEAQPKEFKGLW